MKTVTIVFPTGQSMNKGYEYYLLEGQDANVGDTVIVDSPYGGYTAVKVTSINLQGKATTSVVDVVDDKNYILQKEVEKRRKAILLELEKVAKRADEKRKYDWLAEIDPEAARLVEELKGL